MSSNGASRKHQASPLSLRFRKWTMQTASNVILALLVLHWVYMMCQIIHHDPPLPPPSLVQPLFPTNYTLYPPHRAYPFNFTWKWHPQNRSDRFPSVEERVKLYMSDWYVPACDEEDLFQYSPSSNGDNDKWPRVTIRKDNVSATLDSIVEPDMLFVADRETIADCARTFSQLQRQGTMHTEERIKKRTSMQSYCSEMVPLVDYIAGQESFVPKESRRLTPIISYFGDLVANYPSLDLQFPFIGKWRAAATKQQLDQVTSQSCIRGKRSRLETIKPLYNTTSPIIWKLEMGRHWDPLPFARGDDWHWEDKQLGALWRGDLTGLVHTSEYTDEQICFGNARCRFVFDHRHSKLIDAKLSSGLHLLKGDGNISGVPVIGDRVSMQRIQKYKVIISMEGNDVASGLKWSLLSESVVLMPPPTRTSWAMEELLEPWVHYLPMSPDGSNAEEMIRWVGENDEEARKIAERGRLFIYDLVYHPDAAREEQEIKTEIARRYRALFAQ